MAPEPGVAVIVAGNELEQTACGKLSVTVGLGLMVNTPEAGSDGHLV